MECRISPLCSVNSVALNIDHRMVWVERDFKDHLAQAPCHRQEHLLGCSKPCPDWLGGIHKLSGQQVPVPHHPHSKEFFQISNLNPVSFSLKSLSLILSLHTHVGIY